MSVVPPTRLDLVVSREVPETKTLPGLKQTVGSEHKTDAV